MPTDQRAAPTLAQADTLLAVETPSSLVNAGSGEMPDILAEPRYAGGALLGRGGMGEVRLYRDRRLGREVAVKVLRIEDGPGRRRFVREARVQGQLEHPSVVPVYDLEITPDGEARITMKRVRGHTLETVLSGLAAGDSALARRFSRRRLLTAFVSVCRALEYAHTRGVVHRDVKPANVMLGDFGEVHLLDWGIARVPGGGPNIESPEDAEKPSASVRSSAETAMGAIVGTPAYMSPEQASGRTDLIDGRTDVFALGAVLFEILTLSPMIAGRTIQEMLNAARNPKEARSPAAEHPESDVPPELDEAVRRATEPDLEERYSSAGSLAEAVDRYLDGDRDLAARRALAEEQVERAREALRSAEGHAEEAEMRASAVRALARAVALDPHHEEASSMLGQLLVETPRELPKEAAAELSAAREVARKTAAWGGVYRMVGVVVLGFIGAWMGVRERWIGLLALTALFASSLLSVTWLRAERADAGDHAPLDARVVDRGAHRAELLVRPRDLDPRARDGERLRAPRTGGFPVGARGGRGEHRPCPVAVRGRPRGRGADAVRGHAGSHRDPREPRELPPGPHARDPRLRGAPPGGGAAHDAVDVARAPPEPGRAPVPALVSSAETGLLRRAQGLSGYSSQPELRSTTHSAFVVSTAPTLGG